jgi:hypothetical protein
MSLPFNATIDLSQISGLPNVDENAFRDFVIEFPESVARGSKYWSSLFYRATLSLIAGMENNTPLKIIYNELESRLGSSSQPREVAERVMRIKIIAKRFIESLRSEYSDSILQQNRIDPEQPLEDRTLSNLMDTLGILARETTTATLANALVTAVNKDDIESLKILMTYPQFALISIERQGYHIGSL